MASNLTHKDFKQVPWKNGGGTTLELFRIDAPNDPDKILFRLSQATVSQSGPFSQFPQVDRYLLLLKGDGFQLDFSDGNQINLNNILDPIQFAGETKIQCHLNNGECVDFNVMTDRNWGKAKVTVFPYKTYIKLHEPETTYLYFIHEQKLVILGPEESYTLLSSGPVIKISVTTI